MARNRAAAGPCPQCGESPVTCTHNGFVGESATIDSWEHRCGNCGFRETKAFRSDEPPDQPGVDPKTCPFCGRRVEVAN